jgi:superfamily II DNA or RNA helicase
MDTLLSTLKTTIINFGMPIPELIQSFKDHIYGNDAHMKNCSFMYEIVCASEKSETTSKEIQLWCHVSTQNRDKICFPKEDVGIDLLSTDMTYCGQVKHYKKGSYVKVEDVKQSTLCFLLMKEHNPDNPPDTLEFITPSEVKLSKGKLPLPKGINHITFDIEVVEKWIKRAENYQLPETIKSEKFTLRRGQSEALEVIKDKMSRKETVHIEMICGSGKTDMICYLLKHIKTECKVLILVPRLILLEQWSEVLKSWDLKHSCCGTGSRVDLTSRIIVCVYNSFDKVKEGKYDYFVIDESHHMEIIKKVVVEEIEDDDEIEEEIEDEEEIEEEEIEEEEIEEDIEDEEEEPKTFDIENRTYIDKIQEAMKTTPSICMSATMRTTPNYRYTLEDGIKDKVLCDYQFIVLGFSTKEYQNALICYIEMHPEYSHVLAYANSIESAVSFTKKLNEKGIRAVSLSCNESKSKRNEIMESFKSGKSRVLVSVNTLGEGVNIPIANTCLFIEPRSSQFSIIQASMRVMRTSVDKSMCYIILPCVDEVKETSKFVGAFINRDNRLKDIIVNRKDSHRLVVEEGDKDFKIKDADFMWERIYNSFDTFMEKYWVLKEFYEQFGRFPKQRESFNGYNIGQWLASLKHRKNELKAEQVQLLDGVDPSWKDAKMKILSFEENFALLKEFHEKESRLPTYRESFNGYNIGLWLSNLKQRKNELKVERVKLLDDIDPSWKDAKMKTLSFEENFALLKEFHEKESRLPTYRESFNGYNIGQWSASLKKKKNELKAEQVQLLDGVDPSWKDAKILSFEENFALLKEFHEKESRLPKQKESFNGYNIGQWLARLKQRKNELKAEQVQLLDGVDPSWKDMKTRRGIELLVTQKQQKVN